jgi:hypothetical protein
MKKLFFITTILVSSLFAQTQRYEVKSAIIEYEINGTGTVMGAKALLSGTSLLYFKDYGNVELNEEKIAQTIMGEKEEEHSISKLVADKVYTVDFEDEIIYEQKILLDDNNNPLLNMKESDLVSMGAKKIGTEKILGYLCNVWELGEDKLSIYKSIPLKIVTTMMGITQTQEAKIAKFDIKIDEDKFKLPDYPIKTVEDILKDGDTEVPELSPEQEKMMEDMMKQMGNVFSK